MELAQRLVGMRNDIEVFDGAQVWLAFQRSC